MKSRMTVTLRVLSGSLLAAACTAAWSQSPPGSMPVGPMFAYPEIEVAVRGDSNIAIQPDATKRSDTIYYIRPAVRLEAKDGASLYELGYRGEYGRYSSFTSDNYENHDLFGNANMTFDARNRLNARLQFVDKVDPRGTLNLVATPTPNEYHQTTGSALYSYGAEEAQGRVELQGSYYNKEYVNNRFATFVLDHDRAEYGGTFLWQMMPRTYATATFRRYDYAYKDPSVTLDSHDNYYLVGVRWDATAATSGRFSAGRQTKKFDGGGHLAGRQDFAGTAWEGGITWKPVSYSSLDLSTTKSTRESTGLGDFTVSQTLNLTSTHSWTSTITSYIVAGAGRDSFQNAPVAAAGGTSREDTTRNAGLKVTYNIQRWLKVGAEYLVSLRNSNDDNFDYKRSQAMIFVAATL
jgi:hypothetical protein